MSIYFQDYHTENRYVVEVQSTLDLVKFLGSRVYFTKSKNFTISNTAKMDNFQNLVENKPSYDLNCTRKIIILISSRF